MGGIHPGPLQLRSLAVPLTESHSSGLDQCVGRLQRKLQFPMPRLTISSYTIDPFLAAVKRSSFIFTCISQLTGGRISAKVPGHKNHYSKNAVPLLIYTFESSWPIEQYKIANGTHFEPSIAYLNRSI